MSISPVGGNFDLSALFRLPVLAPPPPVVQPVPPPVVCTPREPSYHPQLTPTGGPGATPSQPSVPSAPKPYGAGEFSSYIGGQQSREIDVDLMRLSYATYDDGPQTVPGWTQVTDVELTARGMDPKHLDVPGSQFRAEVFGDGAGNFVLAYRGTADGLPDWQTNFAQGTGLYTDEFDRLAPQAAAEFKAAFATYSADADGNTVVDNLAITGHSQGGGLATVGSLMTGIPAVTFDASGVHNLTMERLGIDPAAARSDAQAGQVRRYSLDEDALTQVQEASPLAVAAPDALGFQIVVKPEGALDDKLPVRALERIGLPDVVANGLGGLLNAAGDAYDITSNLPGPLSVLSAPFAIPAAANFVASAGASHDQTMMIDTLVQQQPWQPGYVQPTDLNRDLNGLVPQVVQDVASDVVNVFAQGIQALPGVIDAAGNAVDGAIGFAGDVVDEVVATAGDVVDNGRELVEAGADAVDDAAQWMRDRLPW